MKRLGLCFLLLLPIWPSNSSAGEKKAPCVVSLSNCPRRGCADPGTADAISNSLKHNLNPKGPVRSLSFADFESLQEQAQQVFNGKFHTLSKSDRIRLRHLQAGGQEVGEGDLVEVIGFIAVKPAKSEPHANASGESVNCRLQTAENNDFHISVTPSLEKSEFKGIVVEMIPQKRHEKWTEGLLRKVQKAQLLVRVRGQLFFDNHHMVNDDENKSKGGQPKRFSLWEIHPVTQFDVCTAQQCTTGSSAWKALEDWE